MKRQECFASLGQMEERGPSGQWPMARISVAVIRFVSVLPSELTLLDGTDSFSLPRLLGSTTAVIDLSSK
jgi:hypothetical protein